MIFCIKRKNSFFFNFLWAKKKVWQKTLGFMFFRPFEGSDRISDLLNKKLWMEKRHQRYRLKILPPASRSFFLRPKKRRFHGLFGCDGWVREVVPLLLGRISCQVLTTQVPPVEFFDVTCRKLAIPHRNCHLAHSELQNFHLVRVEATEKKGWCL